MKKIHLLPLLILVIAGCTTLFAQVNESPINESYTYDKFVYHLPPDWAFSEEGTNKDFLTFTYEPGGRREYVVRIRLKSTLVPGKFFLKAYHESLTEIQKDNNNPVDHVEQPSSYYTLGQENCWMLSYVAPAFDHRGFILTPVVDKKMYQVYVFDKIEKKKELREEAIEFLAGLWIVGKEKEKPKSLLAAKTTSKRGSVTGSEALAALDVEGETIPPAKPIPFLDIHKITQAQWDGAVAAAMEGMRLVYGPMTQEEEEDFLKYWAPLRQTPFSEAVDYLNKFNPLLGEFLVYRSAITQTAQLLEEAVMNAGYAAEFGDPQGVLAYRDLASRYRTLLVSRQKRLEQIVKELNELGNPPDGLSLMAERQGRYRKEKDYLQSLVQKFAVEGCWVGMLYDSSMKDAGLGDVYTPEYFYVYSVGSHLYSLKLCIDCNVQAEEAGNWQVVGEANVSDGPATTFIRSELLNPDNIKRESGNGKILSRYRKFDYPEIPLFEEISEERYAELIRKESDTNWKMWLQQLKNEQQKNRLAEAFYSTAVAWSEEERWEEYEHDPKSVFLPAEMLLAFHAEMEGAAPAAETIPARQEVETAATEPAVQGLHPVEDKTAVERKQLDQETIQFHLNNLAVIEKNMVKDREELSREKDPQRRDALQLRILGAQADMQAEKDRIATIETGEIVHNRSPWDEYARTSFIQNIADNQRRLENMSRSIRKAYDMADKLPYKEAEQVRNIINTRYRGEMVSDMDEAKVQSIVEEASDVARGYYRTMMEEETVAGEKQLNRAEWANVGLQTAEVVKTAADYSMTGLSLFGGQYVNNVYQGVTGYIEGGPRGAFLNVAGAYNTATGIAVDGFKGFEEAVNKGGGITEGLQGAAWEASIGYIRDKAIAFGAGKISTKFARPNGELATLDGPNAPKAAQGDATTTARKKAVAAKDIDDFNRPLTTEEIAVYREQVSDGRIKVNSYRKTFEKLEQARKAGAPVQDIRQILAELDDRSAKIHSSPQAKMIMKTLQKDPANLEMIKRYSNSMDRVHQKVENRFQDEMAAAGWSREELEPIRNRPDPAELQRAREKQARGEMVQAEDLLGTKTVNMDYDIGIKVKTGADGRPISPMKNGEPTSVVAWHAEAQEAWERAYRSETGQSPTHSWENVTHAKLGDAYRDLSVLQRNGILHANKAWAGQTADVTYFKATHLRGEAEFQRVEKYVEIARGTAKDYRTKMSPLLDSKKPQSGTASHEVWQKHKEYWEKVYSVMDRMGSGRTDPMSADREIRELTGGKSLMEVTFDLRNFMESLMIL
ncbi:MAG: hypothetical protein PHZ13_08950 [bacterium]|nr:hypothetical protein [bacterium]MDD3625151.1 hypothetical protein [Proteiniphilum sp.]